jgi:hypothetical protein
MKWFDRWFYKKAKWAWEHKDEMEQDVPIHKMRGSMQIAVADESWEDGLRINVKKMIGGFVVSFRCYDRKTDRSYRKVYVIQDELDFERELGKIITMESMRG